MTDTLQAMADKRRIFLEAELVRIAKELAVHTNSPAYAIPFKKGNKFVYVVVGPRNAIHGILARTKINDDNSGT